MSLLLLFNFQRHLVIDLGTSGDIWADDFAADFGGRAAVGGGGMIEAAATADGWFCPIEFRSRAVSITGDSPGAIESVTAVWSDSDETGYLDVGDRAETGLLTGAPA